MTSRNVLILLAIGFVAGGIWLMQNLRKIGRTSTAATAPDAVASPSSGILTHLDALLQHELKSIEKEADANWPDAVRERQMTMLKRFNAGDYGATLELARMALEDSSMPQSFHAWVSDQMASILVALGWLEVKQEKCEQALTRFEEADRYRVLPESLKGAGFCRYQLKEAANAASSLRQYIEMDGSDLTVRLIYADALESLGRFREAAQALEAIPAGADGLPISSSELSKRIQSMKAKIAEGEEQTVLQFNQFSIAYRPDLHEELIPVVTETLDNGVQDLVEQFGFAFPRPTIEVVLYPASNFQQVVSYGPEWAQGLFDGRMRIPISNSPQETGRTEALRRILRHELSHALVSETLSGRSPPTWFNEGLAQRVECLANCGTFSFTSRASNFLPQGTLESSFTQLEAPLARQAYLQSLYLVLVLEQQMGVEGALRRVVGGLGSQSYATSDQLLKPIGLTFSRLHQHAEKLWNQQYPIPLNASAN